ncbi:MAG: Glyoxalase-like domain protein [Verrucomicrobiaceae bacterium]|nr:Glyoxalase-like domain protein [Verrucomicrobiaceae bacterium]
MSRKIIVHLSTKDVPGARAFYTALGFTVNEQISGETSVCIVMGDTISAMFTAEPTFATFSPRAICDTSKALEVLNCLSCSSRAEVDDIIQKALAAGGGVFEEAEDHDGVCYQHSFIDPDGHGWNLFHMVETP